nr:hypothetical protein [Escherichia coli]
MAMNGVGCPEAAPGTAGTEVAVVLKIGGAA